MNGVVWVVDVEAKPERVWVRGLLYDASGGDEVREMGSRGPQAAVNVREPAADVSCLRG